MQLDTTNLTGLTDADLVTVIQDLYAEQARRATVAGYASSQAAAQAAMQAAIQQDTAAATAYTASTVYQPGASVTEAGAVYWWPGPGTITNDDPATSTHWVKVPAQAPASTPWTVGMALAPGEYVSNGGHTYQWVPAAVASAPANYAPTGTTSTASWTFIS
ncbi:hypothetical protein [Humibacter ginsenosidimutans]|uniref:Chitin-binding type-3 domain-containing protein n=1 Tax=Humibacter ginsenosidimutans TaxID=2599293 RepID=A0A5B8M589_9MICO|nr:hypothetical protein [Humibacter ginsenosidimutans]QDZ15767.1 hypothetical protein FPZ11_14255 [Humibacter ginsenosidimutans]